MLVRLCLCVHAAFSSVVLCVLFSHFVRCSVFLFLCAGALGEEPRLASLVLEAFERFFRDAHDAAHYTTDYSTKWSDSVGVVLPHLCHGFDNLQPLSAIGVAKEQSLASGERAEVDSYAQKKGERRGAAGVVDRAALVERGRLAIVRLETSANRSVLKKLLEMMFHLLYGHECFKSHRTWTIFMAYPILLARQAQEVARRRARGEAPLDFASDGAFEPLYAQASDDVAAVPFMPEEAAAIVASAIPDEEEEEKADAAITPGVAAGKTLTLCKCALATE